MTTPWKKTRPGKADERKRYPRPQRRGRRPIRRLMKKAYGLPTFSEAMKVAMADANYRERNEVDKHEPNTAERDDIRDSLGNAEPDGEAEGST